MNSNSNQQTFKIIFPKSKKVRLDEIDATQENIQSNLRLEVSKVQLLENDAGMRITLKKNARLSTVKKALFALNIKYVCKYDVKSRGKYKKKMLQYLQQNAQIKNVGQPNTHHENSNQIQELKKMLQDTNQQFQQEVIDLKHQLEKKSIEKNQLIAQLKEQNQMQIENLKIDIENKQIQSDTRFEEQRKIIDKLNKKIALPLEYIGKELMYYQEQKFNHKNQSIINFYQDTYSLITDFYNDRKPRTPVRSSSPYTITTEQKNKKKKFQQ